jgi:hypothetical protein
VNWRLVIACVFLWPLPAQAVELHHIDVVTGTQGLSHVPVHVRNTGVVPLSCTIELAHWYSIRLEEALPGGRTVIDLWFDQASGTYLILNEKQEQMPVEAAWCGIAGRAYETRMPIALDRSKGAAPMPRVMVCAAAGGSLACR